jgi:hypothetical protein
MSWQAAANLMLMLVLATGACQAAEDVKKVDDKKNDPIADIPAPDPAPRPGSNPGDTTPDPLSPDIPGLTRLDKKGDVWFDPKRKIVVVDGRVALREGPLEMFACPKGTKEHESLVAVNAKPMAVHAGLLAAGAVAGKPVKWDPKYEPATGDTIEVLILWKDKDGKNKKMRAQEWIRNSKTKKPMEYNFVFAGSSFWIDEDTGTKHYHADAGDFICVSNFATAMLDLPVKSSQENDNLIFEAFTENMPAKGTKVRLVLIPKGGEKKEEKPAEKKE